MFPPQRSCLIFYAQPLVFVRFAKLAPRHWILDGAMYSVLMDKDVPFYYNLSTGKSTWKRPQGYDMQPESKPILEGAGYVLHPELSSRCAHAASLHS